MSFSSDLKAYREKHSYTQAAAGGNGVKAIINPYIHTALAPLPKLVNVYRLGT